MLAPVLFVPQLLCAHHCGCGHACAVAARRAQDHGVQVGRHLPDRCRWRGRICVGRGAVPCILLAGARPGAQSAKLGQAACPV